MKNKNPIVNEEEEGDYEDLQKKLKKCDLISKYFYQMDLKLIGTNAEKRIISPSWKLDDYIEKEIDLYFTFILGEDNTNFDRFVIMLVQIFLFRISENKDYPSEDAMIEIINQIGKDYNYDSNKLLSKVFADYFEKSKPIYSDILKEINNKLGEIIFKQRAIFIPYFMMMSDIYINLLEEEFPDCEKKLFIFIKEKNNSFNIPEESLIDLKSLYQYLSDCDIKKLEQEKNKNNDSNDSDENNNTQETENKNNNDNQEPNQMSKNEYETNIDSNTKLDRLIKEMNEMKSTHKEENSKLSLKIIEMEKKFSDLQNTCLIQRKAQMNLKTKVQNLEEKLFNIQSKDLWKQIVNYHLYHLGIEKTGDYEDRINNIINKLKSYKNSELCIRFFKDVNSIINNGNLKALDLEKKFLFGIEPNYINLIIKKQLLPNIASSEIKFEKGNTKENKS